MGENYSVLIKNPCVKRCIISMVLDKYTNCVRNVCKHHIKFSNSLQKLKLKYN